MNKQYFLDLYQKQQQVDEAAERERQKELTLQTARELQCFLEIEDLHGTVIAGNRVTFPDGLELVTWNASDFGYMPVWAVVGICPKCGNECLSRQQSTVEGVGMMIAGFYPNWDHECPVFEDELHFADGWIVKIRIDGNLLNVQVSRDNNGFTVIGRCTLDDNGDAYWMDAVCDEYHPAGYTSETIYKKSN